jgi:hypothetical protein
MLQTDQINIAEIQKVGRLPVGSKIVFGELETHSGRICVTFRGIVHRQSQQLDCAILCVDGVA